MILYIFWATTFALGVLLIIDNWGYNYGNSAATFMVVASMIVVFGVVIPFMLVTVTALLIPTHPAGSETTYLQQISTSQQGHGNFFLGTGTYNSEYVYVYYAKNADGSYQLDYQYADDVRIMPDGGKPRIVTQDFDAPGWLAPSWLGPVDSKAVIHVPSDAIQPAVNLNLPNLDTVLN